MHKAFSSIGWKRSWLGPEIQKFRIALAAAEASLKQSLSEQQTAIAVYQQDFGKLRNVLQPIVQQLTTPIIVRNDVERTAANERKQIETKEFLQRRLIRHASVTDIGPGRKATLMSDGIESAADISVGSVARISGVGPMLTQRLVDWRRQCEAKFVFDPSQALAASFKQEVERRYADRIKYLKEEAAKIETNLNKAQQMCKERLRAAAAHSTQAARQRDQMKANIEWFEKHLK